MLTLITGQPGAGKTALAVKKIMEMGGRRPIFVDGITDLTLPHEPCPPVEEWTTEVDDPSSATGKKLMFTFPPNAVVIIDEAQRIYRPRAASAKVPPHVAAMETNRHGGCDYILITQHAGLIDPNIRKLCNQHIHIFVTWKGRELLEWTKCGDIESRAERQIAARSSYKPPKETFDRFKSAEVHTKIKRRMPRYVWLFIACVVAIPPLAYYLYTSITGKLKPSTPPAPVAAAPGGAIPSGASKEAPKVKTVAQYVADLEPRVGGMPHTAPVYDTVTAPTVAPWPAACMSFRGECRCYTDRGVRLATVDQVTCRSIVANGYHTGQQEPSSAMGGLGLAGIGTPSLQSRTGGQASTGTVGRDSATGTQIAERGVTPQ